MTNLPESVIDKELRILMLEDNEDDARLISYQLKKSNLPLQHKRVESREDYINEIKEYAPDVILSDYNLPSFNGIEALELKNKYCRDIPFIFITGVLGEERAVETMKKGASDFILKDNLSRLPGVLVSALRENEERIRRIQSEKALKESEVRYRQVIEQAADGIFVGDGNFRFLTVNTKACEIFGYSREEFLQLSLTDIIPDGEDEQVNLIRKQADTGTYHYECKRKRKDGSLFPAEISATRLSNGNYQAIMRDVTERKRNEQALKSALQELNFHANNSPLGFIELDSDFRVKRWSSQAEKLFGYSGKEVIGKDPDELSMIHPEDKVKVTEVFNRMTEGKEERNICASRNITKDGSTIHCEWYNSALFSESGKLLSIYSIVNDVTERILSSNALKMAHQQLQFLMNNSPLGVIQWDHEFKVKNWSPQAEKLFGWTEAESVGKHADELNFIHPDERENVEEVFNGLISGSRPRSIYINRNLTKESTVLHCEWYNSALFDEQGKLVSVLSIVNDITVRKLAEEAKWEGQLEERKRLAREIHDGLGQMLIATKYKTAGLANAGSELDEKIEEIEGMLEKTIDEVRRTSRNLAPRSVEEFGIENAIRSLCNQTEKITDLSVTFNYIGSGSKAENRILNTIYRITQETLNNILKHAKATRVKVELSQSNKAIVLKVEDNGKGFDMDTVDLTKSSGLNNMKERTESLGGRFMMNSSYRKGTQFIIHIPV